MENNIVFLKNVINKQSEFFLDMIYAILENTPYTRKWGSGGEFFLLKPNDDLNQKKNYFEKYIDEYIREELVNPTLLELFKYNKIETLWPTNPDCIHGPISNKSKENNPKIPFEFIINEKRERIGYRYSSYDKIEIEDKRTIDELKVDKIRIIDWECCDDKCSESGEKIQEISLKEFFDHYFSRELYKVFIDEMREAICKAYKVLGIETIPKLTPQFLSDFKQNEIQLFQDLEFEKLKYKKISNGTEIFFSSEITDEFKKAFCRAKQEKLFLALLGKENYANSFITSEYLFFYLGENRSFDFTTVISGYIKCIEQLLKKIVDINLAERPSKDKWIKYNNKKRGVDVRENPALPGTHVKQVKFLQKFSDAFDTSLGSLGWYMHDYQDNWIVSEKTAEKIHEIIKNYADEDRNDHFHKHNIGNHKIVRIIRENTLFLAMVLLGACKLSNENIRENDYKMLGVIDYSFDSLFKRMQRIPKGEWRFIIQFEKTIVKAIRIRQQSRPLYDDDGLIKGNIKFISVQDFSDNDLDMFYYTKPEEADLIINRNNCPASICLVNNKNGKIRI